MFHNEELCKLILILEIIRSAKFEWVINNCRCKAKLVFSIIEKSYKVVIKHFYNCLYFEKSCYNVFYDEIHNVLLFSRK